jgi:hypothetical protein
MSDGLQLPKEGVWLDNLNFTFGETLKSQWHSGVDEASSRVRSNWLLAQLDIRQWSHRYRIDGHPEIARIRYRGQLLSLALLNTPVPRPIKQKYWEWLDNALLKDIQEEQRELYVEIIQQVRGLIVDAAQRGLGGASDGG